jgi:predicted esterase
MLKTFLLFALALFGAQNSIAGFTGEKEDSSTHFLVIPGQNGLGGQNAVSSHSINPFSKDEVTYISTPEVFPDLGQDACMWHLDGVIKEKQDSDEVEKIVIHASSQGTATALNYVAQNPRKVSALILEGVVASGNSAIFHTIKNLMCPGIEYLPGAYYWLPYCAKAVMPFFSPSGEQSIHSADKISTELPIIILHSIKDPQLPFADSVALYHALRRTGNQNVYLIPIKHIGHVNMLSYPRNSIEIVAVNEIFKRHGLPYNRDVLKRSHDIDLTVFQPSLEETEQYFDELMSKENIHQNIPSYCTTGVSIGTAALIAYYCSGVIE